MIHLSRIVLAPTNRRVRRDLGNPYDMHRTIMRAFPGPDEGGPGRVLWRVEPDRSEQQIVLLVQSDKPPDYSRLESGWAALPPYCKTFMLELSVGQRLRFRLRANPTIRRRAAGETDRSSKRLGLLTEASQIAWLQRKGMAGGFHVLSATVVSEGLIASYRDRDVARTHLSVLYEGTLVVTDPVFLREQVEKGIGTAKAFGFGLLSLARSTP